LFVFAATATATLPLTKKKKKKKWLYIFHNKKKKKKNRSKKHPPNPQNRLKTSKNGLKTPHFLSKFPEKQAFKAVAAMWGTAPENPKNKK
jgi:hypothetical protein